VVQSHERAQFALRVATEYDLDRAACPITGTQPRRIFYRANKFRIHPEARARQWNQRNRRRAIRSGRQHSRGCPGSFARQFLPVQHSNAQMAPRQIESNRSADDAPADDQDIESFHDSILSALMISGDLYLLRWANVAPAQGDTLDSPMGIRFCILMLEEIAKTDLKRFHEFSGKHARFFGEILRADPIVGQDGLVSLFEESIYFFRQVRLRRVELLSIPDLQILFRGCDVFGCASFRRFQVAGGKLRRNLRRCRFRRCRLGRLGFWWPWPPRRGGALG
jgi:hypothetical protein